MSDERLCGKPAAFRYTWPGNDEAVICEHHSIHLEQIAEAISMHLQLIPIITNERVMCAQKIDD